MMLCVSLSLHFLIFFFFLSLFFDCYFSFVPSIEEEKQLEGDMNDDTRSKTNDLIKGNLTLSTTEPGTIALTTTPVDLFPVMPKPSPELSLVSSTTSICVHNVFS